ncbi:laccase domain-containing protein [Rhodovibrio salinarum]|uniref:Purine nucleoside phosphorylase n=1 Tax=Rhodovibrio salinarum TaxID=1087 RepID=A0A934V256_9PROT|nr:peptidoglycan editing factor PgeF [Rhodovibrio salinarum]MBK1698594.1 laccase domain-containing protein [Rhodovibrio salinarum]
MPLTLPALEADGVVHGFFTRQGGVSEGIYTGLNCGIGSGDDRAYVRQNRRRAKAALGLDAGDLVTLYQAHTADCVTVDRPWPEGEGARADAMVSTRPNIVLGVLTADCAPVLFVDPEAQVIGAAHSGWRGAVDGVLDSTVQAMEALGAERGRIVAGIGPTIGPDSYEVGPEFPGRVNAGPMPADDFFRPAAREGHFLFDLPGYVRARLARAGVGQAEWIGTDTVPDADRFFSFRRATHRGEGDYGRLLSAIALTG